jgi:putative transposase
VRGLSQIPENAEFANAKLVRKPSGLYFHITTYCNRKSEHATGGKVGVDFGISTNLTLSTGEKINISFPESASVKYNSKVVNKGLIKNSKKKGANHRKRVHRLQVAYEKQNNVKGDIAKKVASKLIKEYDFIAIQDEMIANWHKGLFGKQVQHSAMGFIKARLKTSPKTHVVAREFPSTQKCPICDRSTKHPLEVRHYECDHCGYYHPSRDIKSAEMILTEALRGTG